MLRAIKVRLYTNKQQTEYINKLLGSYRFETILKYKSNWYDRTIINIDRFFP